MVSGVKLILTKQNPRRLKTTQRLCIKTTMTTKQLQRRLYTPKGFLSSRYGTQRRPNGTHTRGKGSRCGGHSPARSSGTQTQLFTLWTHGAVSPAAGPRALPALLLRVLGCGRCWAPPAAALSAEPRAGRPSRCPSTLSVRPSSGRPFHPHMGTHGAARSSCRPHVGPCLSSQAVTQLLSLPGAPGAAGRRAVCRGRRLPAAAGQEFPGPVLHSQQSLSACPASLLGAAGTSPAASHLCTSVRIGLPAAALLPAQLSLLVCGGGG